MIGDSSDKYDEEKPKKCKKSDEDEQVSKKQKPDEVAPRLIL